MNPVLASSGRPEKVVQRGRERGTVGLLWAGGWSIAYLIHSPMPRVVH